MPYSSSTSVLNFNKTVSHHHRTSFPINSQIPFTQLHVSLMQRSYSPTNTFHIIISRFNSPYTRNNIKTPPNQKKRSNLSQTFVRWTCKIKLRDSFNRKFDTYRKWRMLLIQFFVYIKINAAYIEKCTWKRIFYSELFVAAADSSSSSSCGLGYGYGRSEKNEGFDLW